MLPESSTLIKSYPCLNIHTKFCMLCLLLIEPWKPVFALEVYPIKINLIHSETLAFRKYSVKSRNFCSKLRALTCSSYFPNKNNLSKSILPHQIRLVYTKLLVMNFFYGFIWKQSFCSKIVFPYSSSVLSKSDNYIAIRNFLLQPHHKNINKEMLKSFYLILPQNSFFPCYSCFPSIYC